MDQIKDSIQKYTPQVEKLAKVLSGDGLQQTVDSIYTFLYDHLQYKADGEKQLLRSPACSWSDRKTGIDCKSYSIFAGCLLRSLGVSFYIRKIKQPGLSPAEFTHVYIVIPKDQNGNSLKDGYYVIDPTLHSNNETRFTEKKDILMEKLPHYGLKGAGSQQIAVIGHSMPSPCGIPLSVRQKCNDFFDFMRDREMDHRVIDSAQAHTLECFRNNIDPSFSISEKEMKIQGISYPLLPAYRGLNGEFDPEVTQQLFQEFKALSGLKDLYESTIGAVLGNNWRLGCWNTSNSPAQTERELPQDYQHYLTESGVQQNFNTQTFNAFIEPLQAYYQHREFGRRNGKLAKCTRDANQVGFDMMRSFYEAAVARAQQILRAEGGDLVADGTKTLTTWSIGVPSGYYNGALVPTPGEVETLTIRKFRVINPTGTVYVDPNTGGSSSTGGGSTGSGSSGTASTIDPTFAGFKPQGVVQPTRFNDIRPNSSPALINEYIEYLIDRQGLNALFRNPGTREHYRNNQFSNPNLELWQYKQALWVTEIIDQNNGVVPPSQLPAAAVPVVSQAGFSLSSAILIGAIALGTYYYSKKRK